MSGPAGNQRGGFSYTDAGDFGYGSSDSDTEEVPDIRLQRNAPVPEPDKVPQ